MSDDLSVKCARFDQFIVIQCQETMEFAIFEVLNDAAPVEKVVFRYTNEDEGRKEAESWLREYHFNFFVKGEPLRLDQV